MELIGNTSQNIGADPAEKIDKGPTVFNRVERTVSGHQFEVDDTVGNERIKRRHTAGTFEEWDADGGRTVVVVGHNYSAHLSGNSIVVNGACNITVNGDCNLQVEKSLRAEAEDIYLNSRKSMNISAGTTMSLETREAADAGTSTGSAPGGDIGIVSAGGYNLTVKGEATEIFEKSLETEIRDNLDLTIDGNYEVEIGTTVDGNATGDFIFRCAGDSGILTGKELALGGHTGVKIVSSDDLTVKSVSKTQFDSSQFKIASGPVNIVPAITADSTIDADGEITGPRDVKLSQHKHTGDGRSDPAAPTSIPL